MYYRLPVLALIAHGVMWIHLKLHLQNLQVLHVYLSRDIADWRCRLQRRERNDGDRNSSTFFHQT